MNVLRIRSVMEDEFESLSSATIDENIQGFNLAYLYVASEIARIDEHFAEGCLGISRKTVRALAQAPKERLQLLANEIRHFIFFKLTSDNWERYKTLCYEIKPVSHQAMDERAAVQRSVENLIIGFLSVSLNLFDSNPKETALKYNLDDGLIELYASYPAISIAQTLSGDLQNLHLQVNVDEVALCDYLASECSRSRDLARLDLVSKRFCFD